MSLTRLQADIVLLFVAVIWGIAFVAQKMGASHLGPLAFTALRFALSALVVLPFALREKRKTPLEEKPLPVRALLLICAAFTLGLVLQQTGIAYTTVANGGFLTGLYVICVPVFGWLIYRDRIAPRLYLAAALSLLGLWYLSGSADTHEFVFHKGDILMVASAAAFGLHLLLLGKLMHHVRRPLTLCLLQYAFVVAVTGGLSFIFETTAPDDIRQALWPLLYGGLISGGIAYTLQAVGQQFTPPSDSAIILSSELIFAAIAGVLLLQEQVTPALLTGGFMIVLAIVIVEAAPFLRRLKKSKPVAADLIEHDAG